jgi:hypothetical protein
MKHFLCCASRGQVIIAWLEVDCLTAMFAVNHMKHHLRMQYGITGTDIMDQGIDIEVVET